MRGRGLTNREVCAKGGLDISQQKEPSNDGHGKIDDQFGPDHPNEEAARRATH